MSRYKTTKTSKMKHAQGSIRHNKSIKFQTTLFNDVPERDSDIYVITQPGDRLDNLAAVFYDDPSLWWFIANVNGLTTMNIETGTSLRIPATTENAKGK